jgi:hypothetical protein
MTAAATGIIIAKAVRPGYALVVRFANRLAALRCPGRYASS